ncbi:SDR family oxidoreductase [Cytobacillus depressus]|uniref:SDR family oxidoreductase n=1 Tax=Cytobacillus depressus TaxID=1602942 RepID=A0A6L3V1I3_9BACI|nr:SDR family oxidoreductase [Cytobacillus depressus]KAB2329561.1 SDR family oxidoreductase [Cytobacillus depressus]
MDLELNGKNAIVVASSQGLGRAIAEELVREGANVVITSRNGEKLEKVKSELEELGSGRVYSYVCDVTNYDQIKSLVASAREAFGKIDILINNAGGPPAGNFEDFDDEAWQQAFELNLLSYIRLIREVLPDLKKEGGRIVNLASTSVKQPIPGLILSNSIRLGVVGLSKSLSAELAPYNILVNTVGPGLIRTERLENIRALNAKKKGVSIEEEAKKQFNTIPLGRYGEPSEFAKVVTFLASGANTYITGSTLHVDGGMVTSV